MISRSALLSMRVPQAPDPSPQHEAMEPPAVEEQEHATGVEAMDETAHYSKRLDHHREMAKKASSKAARAVHKKLQAHYTNRLKK